MSLEYFQKRGRTVGENFSNKQNRRQFLAGALRYMTLSLIGFVAFSTIKKRRRLVLEYKCINDYICTGCELYESCQLPEAMSKKESVRENLNADK